MSFRLTRIDDLTRKDHYYLEADDECLYFGEYTARKGYTHSDTNDLIINYKKPMNRQGSDQWRHKERATDTVGSLLAGAFKGFHNLENTLLIPVPPSRVEGDPMHDPRLIESLQLAKDKYQVDINFSDCIAQRASMQASHELEDGQRPTPEDLLQIYSLDEVELFGYNEIVIFDDMLTTASHFKAVQKLVRKSFPDVFIAGVFVARRELKSQDAHLFTDLF